MKKTFKMMMAAVMTMAMVGFVACKKDDDKKTDEPEQQTYEESTTFEILYNGRAVAAGTTVDYTLTQEEIDNDDSDAEFFVKNKSNATTLTLMQASAKLKMGLKKMKWSPPQIGNQSGR